MLHAARRDFDEAGKPGTERGGLYPGSSLSALIRCNGDVSARTSLAQAGLCRSTEESAGRLLTGRQLSPCALAARIRRPWACSSCWYGLASSAG
jgi:hypothetical protein